MQERTALLDTPAPAISATSGGTQANRIGWPRALFGTWFVFLGPGRIARSLEAASGFQLFAGVLLAAMLIMPCAIYTIISFEMAEDFITVWPRDPIAYFIMLLDDPIWRTRHLLSGMLSTFAAMAAGVIAAWFLMIRVHNDGPLTATLRRAAVTVLAGAGLLSVMILAFPLISAQLGRSFSHSSGGLSIMQMFHMNGMPASIWFMIAWLTRAADAIRPPSDADPPPRCEGCGYDLTHRPESGTCNECGMPLDLSFEDNDRKNGWEWEEAACNSRILAWIEATISLIIAPTLFYRELAVRGDAAPSQRFARLTYVAIGVGAAFWVVMLTLMRFQGIDAPIDIAPFVALLASLAGWLTHAVVTAITTSVWLRTGALPSIDWGRRIAAYETAYLWVFCAANGAMLTMMFLANGFVRQIGPALRPFTGSVPPEPAILMLVNGALIAVWFIRYARATRAVRWSNF